jgi:hypothetical protein
LTAAPFRFEIDVENFQSRPRQCVARVYAKPRGDSRITRGERRASSIICACAGEA